MSNRAIYPPLAAYIRFLLLAIAALVLLIILPGTVVHAQDNTQSISGQLSYAEGAYRINVGDMLSVNIYNQPDLSSTGILVRSDGNASFNGIGEVQVAGKTIREATLLIENELHDLLKDPRVSLTITDSKPPAVYLAGAVMHPGMLQAGSSNNFPAPDGDPGHSTGSQGGGNSNSQRMDFRLSNVLGVAGGVKLTADLANVMITRDGQPYRTVNLWGLIKQGDTGNDVMLQNGDSVFIPELPEQALDDATYQTLLRSTLGPRTFPVRVIGEVKNPGVFELNGTSPFLNSALSKGGGFTIGANRKVIAIRRFTGEDKFSTLFVDPNKFDFILRPNDVVYVSETKIYKSGRYAEDVSRVLSPFNTVTSTIFSFALLKNNF